MEDFSVVVIAKNEEKTLPRLLKSLEGVNEIIVVDTGSTDNTVEVAKSFGAKVESVGDRFIETPTLEDIKTFKKRYGFKPSFTTESKLFNYAEARNYGMTLASNDFVFQPDADEEVEWDIDEVRNILPFCDQLTYRFCFAHNPDGTPALEFAHCKFFRRSRGHWVKKVHEIVADREDITEQENLTRITYTDAIYLHHWQDFSSENRGNYLPKLEYAILEKENDDRNTYYLAREYYYASQYKRAIDMFHKYLKMSGWKPERSQAYIFMGDCYKYMGDYDNAILHFHKAMIEDDSRREPFFACAMAHAERGQPKSAIIYLKAALEIPYNPHYYLNFMSIYDWETHEQLSYMYDKIGDYDNAQHHWLETLKARPADARILSNGKWFCRKIEKEKGIKMPIVVGEV